MHSHHLTVTRTARYFVLGEAGPQIKQVWVVLHGYGQLAEFFLRKFRALDDGQTLVVAPEALSRFYLDGAHSRVGASWMTREDRQTEITDYTAYLNQLHHHLAQQLPADMEWRVLGFSQGVATACRWVAAGQVKCSRLVLWGGVFPPDLHPEEAFSNLKDTQLHLAAGRQDALVTPGRVEEQLRVLQTQGLNPELHWYEGGHDIDEPLLLRLHRL